MTPNREHTIKSDCSLNETYEAIYTSDQDLLDIIETLKTLQIQQQQIIERQQDLTQQLDHILAGRGGDMANPHRVSTVSPHTSDLSNPHRDGATSPVTSG